MFPELKTENYNLQQILKADQAFIFEGLGHPGVVLYYGVSYSSFESTAAQMDFYERIWRDKTGCWWKIVEVQTGKAVGACGMNNYEADHKKAEIGYWLLPSSQKKGIMQEVLPVMIKYLFSEWQLNRLEAVIEKGNEASCRLAEKLGFFFEGVLRDAEIKNGKHISLLMYSLLRAEVSGQASNPAG
ncbi:MAG TPA: GNAT family protein [Chitinophagaceae bacterium]|jgi:ribosomal-protein-alanine N-acetyltransferase|nr:GNAT family protein [Chitinophagaceae bacterium]HMU60069.1 GNAT family protein [Chitinophagaceae bacterium]